MKNKILEIVFRYVVMLLVALPNLALFYFIFTPLTVYPTYFLLNLFYDASLISKDIILVNDLIPIELIEACIAGSAYYLLFILNFSTAKINLNKRLKILFVSFFLFLILNIIRIFFLSILAISGSSFFDATHKLFWYSISTIFVVGIWFSLVKIFDIKEIPFYSDIKFLYKKTKKR
ncbi:MAG: hypothetical protein KatS3mg001_425 [Candidatus Pacearchaeota archaeon]|nr:MAG: hypothetical protein KatS3mg001_425 [Candidatus Pacearchaeota archaeon]